MLVGIRTKKSEALGFSYMYHEHQNENENKKRDRCDAMRADETRNADVYGYEYDTECQMIEKDKILCDDASPTKSQK